MNGVPEHMGRFSNSAFWLVLWELISEWLILKTLYGQTGLTEKCRKSQMKISDCDKEVADFIKENCPRAPIAGNSVHMDLNFMRKEMPLSTKELHYR